MINKISLQNRKRSSELSHGLERVNQEKKDELLALKLQALNDAAEAAGKLFDLPLSLIVADPNQPRKTFKNIDSLAKSIREQGILQPILVKPKDDHSGFYQIIVGERRYQAAKRAGLFTLPCIIREHHDANTLILQLLENDQREQVTLLEEAQALSQLINEMGVSKGDVAKELGREPAWISLRLGLLDAPPEVKALIDDEVVQDLRTLHELRKLYAEDHGLFVKIVDQLRTPGFVGSHRDLLRATRAKRAMPSCPRILKAEYRDGRLFLFVEKKRKPLEFVVDSDVLKGL